MPRRGSPSPLLNLPLLIIILPIVALLLLFFVLPSLLSATNHKIRSSAVKNGWDSLNVCLVLFAILCGIFARRNDEDSTTNDYDRSTQNVPRVAHDNKPQQYSVSNQWFDQFSVQKIFANPSFNTPVTSTGRLKRNSSSYPDLKSESLWENSDDHDHFRFFDDFEINKYRSSSEYSHHGTQRSILEESSVKEIQVDTFILRSSTPQKSPAPPTPPPPPPPPRTDHKQNHTYRTVSRKEMADKERAHHHVFKKINSPSPRIPTPTPAPPPPPPPLQIKSPISSEPKYRKSWERKRSNTTREIKMVLASVLHNRRKRKKKLKAKTSSAENPIHPSSQSPFLEPSLSSETPPSPPPVPPPPPPPPTSFFHSLFRKGNKSKRIHSFSTPPPPPPPPPTSKRWSKRHGQVPPPSAAPPHPAAPRHPPPPPPQSKSSKQRNSAATGRPPLPTKGTNLYDENVNTGGQSPLIPMPPPPPPPPFKVPGFRFVLKGDFVKLSSSAHSSSAHSSRCGSPEPEEIDKEPSLEKVNTINDSGRTVFCPSPDVNIKADSFIARLRDGWRLENINSSKEKRSLDQDPEPVP